VTSSFSGALALLLVGGGFLTLGALGWVARATNDAHRRPGRPSVAVDLLAGPGATLPGPLAPPAPGR
jgi:hypothetical protein